MKKMVYCFVSASLILMLTGTVTLAKETTTTTKTTTTKTTTQKTTPVKSADMGITVVGKLGIDMGKAGSGSESDSAMGFTISGEGLYALTPEIEVGAGLEFQLPREVKALDAKVNFIPLYAMGRYKFMELSDFTLYANGKFGYNFFSLSKGDVKAETIGGLCFGASVSATYQKMYYAELGFSMNNGSEKGTPDNIGWSYTKVSLGGGINFSL